ncbi:MAG: hypothetical protein ACRD1V_00930 [Vicinamibacterales bacterium]
MTVRRCIASAVLAIFTMLPSLQVQCEIACAGDDSRPAPGVARQDVAMAAAFVPAPDDCAAHAGDPPMLASAGADVHSQALVATSAGAQADATNVRSPSVLRESPSRPPDSPPTSLALPLRI